MWLTRMSASFSILLLLTSALLAPHSPGSSCLQSHAHCYHDFHSAADNLLASLVPNSNSHRHFVLLCLYCCAQTHPHYAGHLGPYWQKEAGSCCSNCQAGDPNRFNPTPMLTPACHMLAFTCSVFSIHPLQVRHSSYVWPCCLYCII